jgi:hypothetical protein
LAQTRVRQDKIVIDLAQRQLIPQARFALAQRIDSPPDRGDTLADVQVKSFGRVPDACGYSCETSPKPSASSDSPGYQPATSVFDPSLAPLGLHLSTPSLSTS